MSRTIDADVATIRNNIYGKQIREAIASALEDAYDHAASELAATDADLISMIGSVQTGLRAEMNSGLNARLRKFTTLWTNASPTSSFDAQDVSVTPGYNLYLIIFRESIETEGYWTIPLLVYTGGTGTGVSYAQYAYEVYDSNSNSVRWNAAYRGIHITSGNVHFNRAVANGYGSLDDLIPLVILGTNT